MLCLQTTHDRLHDVGKIVAGSDKDGPLFRITRADLVDPSQNQRSGPLAAFHDPVDGEVARDARVDGKLDECNGDGDLRSNRASEGDQRRQVE